MKNTLYPAATIVPRNLTGKILKIVTKDYAVGSSGPVNLLSGKHYDDNTPVIQPLKDIIEALGGTYDEQ